MNKPHKLSYDKLKFVKIALVNDDAQNGQENVLPNLTEVQGKQKISNNFLLLDLIREIIKYDKYRIFNILKSFMDLLR